MDLERCVCWDEALLSRVMETEALQEEDHFFLATHHPPEIAVADRSTGDALEERLSQEDLRTVLLDERERHSLVAIIGNAGSGKSHIVRWLYLNIPSSENRRVILIPKVGTNLRRVIEMILEGMEGPHFDEYRQRLDEAVGSLTTERAKLEFLSAMAIAAGPEGPTSPSEAAKDELECEVFAYLQQALPALLNDNVFQENLTKNSTIVAEIAAHIVGEAGRERRETRRRFQVADFDISSWSISASALNQNARQMYNYLSRPEFRAQTVKWLNVNLDWTVRRMLQLSGEDLGNLMLDVREALAEQGRELILLIEDFAKLQGIERELLEALLVRPDQRDRHLCTLRSAIAVTTGYYGDLAGTAASYSDLAETVRDRINLVVTLDATRTGGSAAQTAMMERFASRYLNAVRVGEEELKDWYRRSTSAAEPIALPSACDTCEQRQDCHRTFGTSAEVGTAHRVGLYPFNPQALSRMYRAAATREQQTYFNPRVLINHVLKHVLQNHTRDIADCQFPSPKILSHYGQTRLSALDKDYIRQRTGAEEADRQIALSEFWGEEDSVKYQPPDLPEAFCLSRVPEPDGQVAVPPPGPEPPVNPEPELPTDLRRRLKELDDWSAGGILGQATVNLLRGLLFNAVCSRIDWDAERLVRTAFASPSDKRPFRQTSLNFRRQDQAMVRPPVLLEIPLNKEDFVSATLGLQGLLLYDYHRGWKFDRATDYLPHYAELIDHLAAEVVRQLRQPAPLDKAWDPSPAAVQLMALGTLLLGGEALFGNSAQRIDALFCGCPEGHHATYRADTWRRLLQVYCDEKQYLEDIVRSRNGATKGSSPSQIVFAHDLLKYLDLALSEFVVTVEVPERVPDEHRKLLRLSGQFSKSFRNAVDEERQRWCQARSVIDEQVAGSDGAEDIRRALEEVVNAARAEGIAPPSQNQMQDEIPRISSVHWDELRRALSDIDRKGCADGCLSTVTNADTAEEISEVCNVLGSASIYLDQLRERVDARRDALSAAGDLGKAVIEFRSVLAGLAAITTEMAQR